MEFSKSTLLPLLLLQFENKCILDNSLKQLRTKKQRNIKLPTHRMRFRNMMDLHKRIIVQKISKWKHVMTLFRISISIQRHVYMHCFKAMGRDYKKLSIIHIWYSTNASSRSKSIISDFRLLHFCYRANIGYQHLNNNDAIEIRMWV